MNLFSTRILYAAFLALWLVSLLWFGAVTPSAVAMITMGTAVLSVASVFLLPEPYRSSRVALAIGAAAIAVVALQLIPLPSGAFPYTEALRAKHGVAGPAPGTGDLFLTVRQLAQVAGYVLAGLFVKRLVDAGLKRMDVLAGVVAILALEGIYALLQVGFVFKEIPFYGLRPYPDSASGTLVNRNNFAGLMAVGLALAAAAAWARFTSPRSPRKLVSLEGGLPWALAAALFAACVVFSRSRGGALAAGAGIVALPFLVGRRMPAVSIVGLVLMAALGTAAVFAADTEPLVERFETLDAEKIGTDTRIRCWEAALEGWKRQPSLGYGIGSFPETFKPFQPPGLSGEFHHAHNEYVNALFEGGIAWLAVLLLAFGFWLWRAVRGLRRLSGSERAAAAACIAAALAIAIHSLVDFDLRITSVGLLFAAVLGAALTNSSTTPTARRIPGLVPALAAVVFALPLWFSNLEPEAPALRAALREPAQAEVALAAILRRSPYDPVAAAAHAMQAERREDMALAADRVATATDLWPSNPFFQRDFALWFLDHGDPERATICFRRLFEQRPSAVAETIAPLWSSENPVAPWERYLPTPASIANFAGLLARLNRWEDAANVFNRGVPAEEKYVEYYDALAESFFAAGQWGLEAAIREKRLAIQSDPAAQAAAAAAWGRLESWDKALEHARIAIRSDPGRADWQGTLADILYAQGEYTEAIDALTQGLRSKPGDLDLRRRRAAVYAKEKLYMIAVDDYRIVVKGTPGDREAVVGLAHCLKEAGRKLDGLAVMETWVEAHPEDLEAREYCVELRK